jgi:hypothetical protein
MVGLFSFFIAFLVVVTCCRGFSTNNCRRLHSRRVRRETTKRYHENNLQVLYSSFGTCLFDNYTRIESPYFTAIFDQLHEEARGEKKKSRLFFCTSRTDWNDGGVSSGGEEGNAANRLQYLKSTLLNNSETNLILLDDYNPIRLEEEILRGAKSTMIIIWVHGSNAFWTRHLSRTSGLDRIIRQQRSDGTLFYIGESAGAAIVGPTMSVACPRGDDPKQSPELQVYGLNLLNEHVSFGLTKEELQNHSKTSQLLDKIEICQNDQVYVWAQSKRQQEDDEDEESSTIVATKFVMTPSRRGMIERYSNPKPILLQKEDTEGGVHCYGEPSIDPSRAVSSIGDSDWFEEESEEESEEETTTSTSTAMT